MEGGRTREQGRALSAAAAAAAAAAATTTPDSLAALLLADDYTGYYYGPDHPMKPQRMAMTHQLVMGYGLHQHMDVYVRQPPACY